MMTGLDAFLCARDDPQFAFHSFLNECLLEQARAPAKAHAVAGDGIKRLVIKIAGASGIDDAQLRVRGVLKPRRPTPAAPSADALALGWAAVEQFLATLRNLHPRP